MIRRCEIALYADMLVQNFTWSVLNKNNKDGIDNLEKYGDLIYMQKICLFSSGL